MILKFHSFKKRSDMYRARKKLPDSPWKIYTDLTKQRLQILSKARELITDNGLVDYVFADINCNLVAKLKNNSYTFFNKFESILTQ